MKYIAWALGTLAVILVIGFISHASTLTFIIALLAWGGGDVIEIIQMRTGGKDDTTLLPYATQVSGVIIMMVWQGFFA